MLDLFLDELRSVRLFCSSFALDVHLFTQTVNISSIGCPFIHLIRHTDCGESKEDQIAEGLFHASHASRCCRIPFFMV